MKSIRVQRFLILLIFSTCCCLIGLYFSISSDPTPKILVNDIIQNLEIVRYESLPLNRTRQIENPSNLKCSPTVFGVSEKDDDKYFIPLYQYPNCSEINPGFLRIENKTIVFSCQRKGMFVYGPPVSEEIYGKFDMEFKWQSRGKFKNHLNTEWIFGKCADLRLAYLRNVFNQEAAQRARRITRRIAQEKLLITKPRPLSVFLIMFDSVSRQSFFRNLNQTVDFLNDKIIPPESEFGRNFFLYDFLINNAQGEKTPQNMGPILYGKTLDKLEDTLLSYSIFDQTDWWAFEDFQNSTALWKYYERNGFVTLFNFDSYTDYVSRFTGRRIFTDHVVSNFWRAANQITGYIDYADEGQCVSNKNAYQVSLDYLSEFIENYEGINKFAYLHMDLAHETTGLRLKIADKDLMEFIERTLSYYSEHPEEDVVMMMGADHGRMEIVMSREAMLEKMLPFHFVFANKQLIERMDAHHNLIHNSDRLVTRFDWHVTLKQLAHAPYGNLNSSELQEISDVTEEHKGISLFSQRVSDDRNCVNAKISGKFCSCQYINYTVADPGNDKYVNLVIDMGINAINEVITRNQTKGRVCKTLRLGSIKSAYEVYIVGKDPLVPKNYYIIFSDKKNPNFLIEIQARFAPKKKFVAIGNNDGLHPIYHDNIIDQRYREKIMSLQIFSMTNTNNEHSCKDIHSSMKPYESFCNCYGSNDPVVSFNILTHPDQSCNDVCLDLGKACEDYEYISKHKTSILRALIKMNLVNSTIETGDILGIRDNHMIMPTQPYCHRPKGDDDVVCLCL